MIRKILESDAESVALLIPQLGKNEKPHQHLKTKIAEIARNPSIMMIGYEHEGRIAGMCTLARIEGVTYNLRPFAIIENVVVDSSVRSRGIGKMLVRHAIETAKEWNCYKVILETGSKDEWKLRFYDDCGLARGEKTAFIKRFDR